MKKVTKKLVLVLVAAMLMGLCLVGCGVEKDVQGEWKVTKINGQTPEEVAATMGVTVDDLMMVFKFDGDKATLTGKSGTQEYKPAYKSDGVELKKDDNIVMSMLYNKDAKTLTFKFDNGSEYVAEKGSYTFGQAAPAEGGEAAPAEGGEAAPADGAEQPAEGGEAAPADGAEQPAEGGEAAE